MSFLMKNFSLRKMIVGHSTSMVLQTKRDVATLEGEGTSLSNKLDFDVTNNVVEYEACIIRLQMQYISIFKILEYMGIHP